MSFDLNLLMVILLLILAAVDLNVGVANDAINFLNSALGSKAAKFKVALTVAAFGVFFGVFFASGMMEVARSGIFNPEMFTLFEVLVIFLALMYSDVVLLDVFNTFGLPTSTTVSLVFNLMGASVGVSMIKVLSVGGDLSGVYQYLNMSSIITIVVAIVTSVVFAFVFGYLFQYLTRLIFTFDYVEKFKKYGAIWTGFALSILSLFIFLKGAKSAVFIPHEVVDYIKNNTMLILGYMFIGWTILIQLMMWFTKINMLKVIVMIGTFGLALSFSANDLVNFIGAPLAGLNAYMYSLTQPDASTMTMEFLKEPVRADIWFLFIAGVIMVATLYFSKKSQNVAKTELSLGRQEEGIERFESNMLARLLVRAAISFASGIMKITPSPIRNWVSSRFDLSKYKPLYIEGEQPPSFDLVRAAVILVVSSGLISLGTSMKLPLSTTYVTFIVAMAAALPDKAWGRDSAVNRVAGVVTVISGWFFTALIAFMMSLIISVILYYGSYFGVIGVGLFVVYAFIHTGKLHKKRDQEEEEKIRKIMEEKENPNTRLDSVMHNISEYLSKHLFILNSSFASFFESQNANLKAFFKDAKKLDDEGQAFIKSTLKLYSEKSKKVPEDGYLYTKSLMAFQELSDRLVLVTKQNHKYIDNNHHKFTNDQIKEVKELLTIYEDLSKKISDRIISKNFENDAIIEMIFDDLNHNIKAKIDHHLNRMIIKKNINYKRSSIYMSTLIDIEMFAKNILFIYKATKDAFMFYIENKD